MVSNLDLSLLAQGAAPQNPQSIQNLGAPVANDPAQVQYAQSSPIQMRPIGGGQVQVINIQTGQVLYTGSASGAANAQASAAGQRRRIID